MRLYKDGGFVDDPWTVPDEGAMPASRPSIVPFVRWNAIKDGLAGLNIPLGVRMEAGEPLDPILADLDRLSLVALVFPKFSDGRSFSKAAQLRQHGFAGEIRAVGDVLWDQLQLMRRSGFDAFAVDDAATLRALERGKPSFMDAFYQPGVGPETPADARRPWARRALAR